MRVIGWAVNAAILCLDCGEDPGEDKDGGPVFSLDEHDYPGCYCDSCGCEIAEPRVPDGYVVREMSTPEIIQLWADEHDRFRESDGSRRVWTSERVSVPGWYWWDVDLFDGPEGPFESESGAVWDLCNAYGIHL